MTYLDHAASAPVPAPVAERIRQLLEAEFGNPSSLHAAARSARKVVEEAREAVAAALGGRPEEIVFTGGGTESDNLAVLGSARRRRREGRTNVVVSAIEHHAVLDTARALTAEGMEVRIAPVGPDGRLNVAALDELVDRQTALVSVMTANNETGVIQPLEETAEIAARNGATLHTDAVQALPWVDCSELTAGLVSVSAHKLGGPKGVGALLVRRGTPLEPLFHGGGQERTLRPGTVNAPGIGGFAVALDLRLSDRDATVQRVTRLRDSFQAALVGAVPGCTVNGAGAPRLPGHLSVCVDGADAETLLVLLDAAGIAASSGSACSSGAAEPSHVLRAMGVDRARARGALRFSLGPETTEEELALVVSAVAEAAARLRRSK